MSVHGQCLDDPQQSLPSRLLIGVNRKRSAGGQNGAVEPKPTL